MKDDNAKLAKVLGHQFSDPSLLQLALTHRSYGAQNNERLEFLGDAVLGVLVSERLFEKLAQANEGELTRLRASLVKGETLAEIATELGLGQHLKLGGGERKSGGHRRRSILADVLEAVLGAIYLDAGLDVCRKCIDNWFGERFDLSAAQRQHKDPKTRLQEFLQGRGQELPVYRVVDIAGEPHNQRFTVACKVTLLPTEICAEADSRRLAEKAAAKLVLAELGLSSGKHPGVNNSEAKSVNNNDG